MGKSRRSRGNAARKDPITTAVKAVKPPSDPELAALREAKILPVIKNLQSSDPKSRSAAASAISAIIQDTRCRKLLLREQVVHTVLTQTLTDTALESRAAGWGILQVLAQEEEADFCIHLHRLDVLTAIEHASKVVSDRLSSKKATFEKAPKAEQALVLSIISSLVSLLTALAEAHDDILEAISANPTIIYFICSLISDNGNQDLLRLRSDAMACLMILCEDNPDLSGKIVLHPTNCYAKITKLSREEAGDSILACAIIHNISAADAIKPVEAETFLGDVAIVPTLSKAIASITPGQSQMNGGGWSSPFELQQLALEILASIGTSLTASLAREEGEEVSEVPAAEDDENMDDADDGADDEDGEDVTNEEDDEMDEDAMHADMDMVTGLDDDDALPTLDDMPLIKSILQSAVPQLIRISSLDASDPSTIHLQGLALSALNNLAWSISLFDPADSANTPILQAWLPVGQSIWNSVISPILASDTADIELAAQVTSLAWATSRSLKTDTPLKDDQHRKFVTLYQATRGTSSSPDPEDPFQSLSVKCIGVLGQIAKSSSLSINREVGTFLITLLTSLPDTPVVDVVEALNQVFDIYGNEDLECDKEVFWKDNYAKHLDEILPKARTMVKSVNKGVQTELRTRAEEVVLNLTRFLAYKRKHKPE